MAIVRNVFTETEVTAGDEIRDFRGKYATFAGITELPAPGKSGRVKVIHLDGNPGWYYPHVYDLEIVEGR